MLFDPVSLISTAVSSTSALLVYVATPFLEIWFGVSVFLTAVSVVAILLIGRTFGGARKIITGSKR